jgi:hypothetical protein
MFMQISSDVVQKETFGLCSRIHALINLVLRAIGELCQDKQFAYAALSDITRRYKLYSTSAIRIFNQYILGRIEQQPKF